MTTPDELKQVIRNLEAQRAQLGDHTVDTAIASIKQQLSTLSAFVIPHQQRKQITVLFADLCEFTTISEEKDPEELSAIMKAYFAALTPPILKNGGVIEKYIGDAIMAVFGLPIVNEKDPHNAVRTAIEMQQAVSQLNTQLQAIHQLQLKLRIGINTGQAVTSLLSDEPRDFAVIGNTVNIASRLESAAPVNGILISQDTYRHVHNVFDLTPQAPLKIKGRAQPLQTYLINKIIDRSHRYQICGVKGIQSSMVGRSKELIALQNAWETTVINGQTAQVQVVGEAGVGKSRLIYEFEKWLEYHSPKRVMLKGCSAEQAQTVPHFLLRDLVMMQFNIQESDPIEVVRQKFEDGISNTFLEQTHEIAHILGQWLGFDFTNTKTVRQIGTDGEQLKNRGFYYLMQYFEKLAEKRPLILILEDIHWADIASLNIIQNIVQQKPNLPLLIITLTRPSLYQRLPHWQELSSSKSNKPHHKESDPINSAISLNPLSKAANQSLLVELLQKIPVVHEQLFEQIINRAEGNPFFMEEIINMLIDHGVIKTGNQYWHVDMSNLSTDLIPTTLTGVLQARLDNLSPDAKKLLQKAAVIGRVFWDAPLNLHDVDSQHLNELRNHDLIIQQEHSTFINTTEYFFKHDLLREVTFQTVLKKDRLRYHHQIANWLSTTVTQNGRADEYAALIGKHYEASAQAEKAATWYEHAGIQAANNYAHEEAIRFLTRALELVPLNDLTTRFTLLEKREQTFKIIGNQKALKEDIEQLVSLAKNLGPTEWAKTALKQTQQFYYLADYTQTINSAKKAIEYGYRAEEEDIISEGYRLWGWGTFRQQQYNQASRLLQKALTFADNQKQKANCLHGLGLVAHSQREIKMANEYYQCALNIRLELHDQKGEALCLSDLGFMFWHQGQFEKSKWHYNQSLLLRRQLGYRFGEGESLFNLGSLAHTLQELSNAEIYLQNALRIFEEVDNQIVKGLALHELGALAFTQSNYKLAEDYFNKALILRQKLNAIRYLIEDWAAIAKLEVIQGRSNYATTYLTQILDYLETNPFLYGTENPLRTYRLIWETFVELKQLANAQKVLTLAMQVMQRFLAQIMDPADQESYLTQPHHQVLWLASKKQRSLS